MSSLNEIIPPEVDNDELYERLAAIAQSEDIYTILEIGSSAGAGSTKAFVDAISGKKNSTKLFCVEVSAVRYNQLRKTYDGNPSVVAYNMSTVSPSEFPSRGTVKKFYDNVNSKLNLYELDQVLSWLDQDIAYVKHAKVGRDAIGSIKKDHDIEIFDVVFIDGSEFSGLAEFKKIYGAKYIILDDVFTYKNYESRQLLLCDPDYILLHENLALRNGYSIFRRRSSVDEIDQACPILFFTIVINGMPFIRYHADMLRQLRVPFVWHIVEGIAALRHDTAWSVANGGSIPSALHKNGLSVDGTTEYLDQLVSEFPLGKVIVHRKPLREVWDGKLEMVERALSAATQPCLLWQIDADELWTASQIEVIRQRFLLEPHRSAASFWCQYYVGPTKIITTRYNYAQNPTQEWHRLWRYEPGDRWQSHEPPVLLRKIPDGSEVDVRSIAPFTQDEMEETGGVFQHYAYVTREQVLFKEIYYGYHGAAQCWDQLTNSYGPGRLSDYLPWVTDQTLFSDIDCYDFPPIGSWDEVTGKWRFVTDRAVVQPATRPAPQIAIDGIYWQDLHSGIGRVWTEMLRHWAGTSFADHLVVLDRVGTAPRIAGIRYHGTRKYNHDNPAEDSIYLEHVCQLLNIDLFLSTYYSTPLETPSVFFGYDMIPEALGMDLSAKAWQEKKLSIRHALAHIMISQHSSDDLKKYNPDISDDQLYVAHCDVSSKFTEADPGSVSITLEKFGLPERYLLMVGDRTGVEGYKNGALAIMAAEILWKSKRLTLVCIGGASSIEPELLALAPNVAIKHLRVDDDTLRSIYAGAVALLYPSRYEGFGLPVIEAMACGCPVITCANSSLLEVAGDAALFVMPDDPEAMAAHVIELLKSEVRQDIVARGLINARRFPSGAQAKNVEAILRNLAAEHPKKDLDRAHLSRGWRDLREVQSELYGNVACHNIVLSQASDHIVGSNVSSEHQNVIEARPRRIQHLYRALLNYPRRVLSKIYRTITLKSIFRRLADIIRNTETIIRISSASSDLFQQIKGTLTEQTTELQVHSRNTEVIMKRLEVIEKLAERAADLGLQNDPRHRLSSTLRELGVGNWQNSTISGEAYLMEMLSSIMQPSVILDVGAHHGTYAKLVKSRFPDARLICFEPMPSSFEVLKKESFKYKFEAYPWALGDVDQQSLLSDYADQQGSQHATLLADVFARIHKKAANSLPVKTCRLDSIIDKLEIKFIDFLKIDTEGSEYSVLNGAGEFLKAGNIRFIQFEFNEMNVISRVFFSDYIALLPSYNLYRLLPSGLLHLDPDDLLGNELFGFQNIFAARKSDAGLFI